MYNSNDCTAILSAQSCDGLEFEISSLKLAIHDHRSLWIQVEVPLSETAQHQTVHRGQPHQAGGEPLCCALQKSPSRCRCRDKYTPATTKVCISRGEKKLRITLSGNLHRISADDFAIEFLRKLDSKFRLPCPRTSQNYYDSHTEKGMGRQNKQMVSICMFKSRLERKLSGHTCMRPLLDLPRGVCGTYCMHVTVCRYVCT